MTTTPNAAPPTAREDLLKGIWRENPTFVMVLGMCPTLAVSNTARNALAMGLATAFVLVASNVAVSSLRRLIPSQVRITTYVLIIASFVTIVDYTIQAISLDLHRALGAFISLIVVNCLILGRSEAFAARNPVIPSLLDALGMGAGFCWALLSIGAVREVLGSGTLFGARLFHEGFQGATLMLLPSGGFFALAGLTLLLNAIAQRQRRRERLPDVAAEVAR